MSRAARKVRETAETRVEVFLDIDEGGKVEVLTPIAFLNHMLSTMFTYMNATALINASEKLVYDEHHVVEDIAITVGEAFKEVLGDKVGIKRFASMITPMDDALVLVAVDISGRGGAYVKLKLWRELIGDLATENVIHFINSLAINSGITIHVIQLSGLNTHHIVEALFKGLGMTLYEASRIVSTSIRSTKGSL